jgi:HSP20 family protein
MARTDQPRPTDPKTPQESTSVPISERPKGESGGQERRLARRGFEAPWSGSPFSFIRRFSEDMDRLFEEFGFGQLSHTLSSTGGEVSEREFGRGMWHPAIEMFERGDELVVRADLPGMRKEDIRVECTRDAITIQGERKNEQTETRGGRFHTERSYGRFYRRIPLPEGVNPDDARANFRDGVLEINLKAPKESQTRRIEIQS